MARKHELPDDHNSAGCGVEYAVQYRYGDDEPWYEGPSAVGEFDQANDLAKAWMDGTKHPHVKPDPPVTGARVIQRVSMGVVITEYNAN